jgi:NADPH-dependent 2,4-dienoyl-CoA reductase/sulfur reductase-like enzyme
MSAEVVTFCCPAVGPALWWYSQRVRTSGLIAVGSGPAGLRAAAAFRAHHPQLPVQILTADPAMPYAKPPLSKDFLCGRGQDVDLHSPDWFARRRLELVRGITVDHIDLDSREVVTRGGRRYPYWHLVLAPGARPVPLDVPGARHALQLRSLGERRGHPDVRAASPLRRGDRRGPDRVRGGGGPRRQRHRHDDGRR